MLTDFCNTVFDHNVVKTELKCHKKKSSFESPQTDIVMQTSCVYGFAMQILKGSIKIVKGVRLLIEKKSISKTCIQHLLFTSKEH